MRPATGRLSRWWHGTALRHQRVGRESSRPPAPRAKYPNRKSRNQPSRPSHSIIPDRAGRERLRRAHPYTLARCARPRTRSAAPCAAQSATRWTPTAWQHKVERAGGWPILMAIDAKQNRSARIGGRRHHQPASAWCRTPTRRRPPCIRLAAPPSRRSSAGTPRRGPMIGRLHAIHHGPRCLAMRGVARHTLAGWPIHRAATAPAARQRTSSHNRGGPAVVRSLTAPSASMPSICSSPAAA